MGAFIGGIYAIIGLGFSLIFAGVKFMVNLTHGQLVILASYLSLVFVFYLQTDPLLSMLFILPIIFCLGFFFQYWLLNRTLSFDTPTGLTIILGVSLIIQNVLLVIFGPDAKSLSKYSSYATAYVKPLGVHIPVMYLIDFLAALLVMFLFYIFLKYTHLGRAIRATSEDSECAQLFGINYRKIYALTFGLGSMLAGIGGVLTGLTFSFDPNSGGTYLEMAFSVLILGGMGSLRGAMVGGVILGIVQALSAYYIGPAYKYVFSSILTLVILAIRPEGILGYKV
jgi:branched-chain amino acid transport system permease protein